MSVSPIAQGPPDAAAFHAAIEARSEQWLVACLRVTRDRDLAEDALQEGLLSAWRKRDQFKGDAALHTWVHRVVINAALQLLRSRARHVWGNVPFEVEDTEPSPAAQVATDALTQHLETVLGRLTPVERVCFVLRHFEQWRLKEIGEELDMNEGQVKQALFRAVKKLRANDSLVRRLG